MNDASPFHETGKPGRAVEVVFDGEHLLLADGMNLAAALLGAGKRAFRATPLTGAPRGPFCMMGACFDCLVEIDGVTVQACQEQVRAGLVVGRAPERSADDRI